MKVGVRWLGFLDGRHPVRAADDLRVDGHASRDDLRNWARGIVRRAKGQQKGLAFSNQSKAFIERNQSFGGCQPALVQ